MGEIKTPEVQEIKKPIVENYQNIKPERKSDADVSREFIRNNFKANSEIKPDEPKRELVDGHLEYYDDNGVNFRTDNELKPDSEYNLNGYHYETDNLGRISSVEGKLQLREREDRLEIRDSIKDIGKGDQQEGDDRGHLIADRFKGSNGLENIVAQDSRINQVDYNRFESSLAEEVKLGKDVRVRIEPDYSNDSHRPNNLFVTYSIDGEKNVRIFPNRKD